MPKTEKLCKKTGPRHKESVKTLSVNCNNWLLSYFYYRLLNCHLFFSVDIGQCLANGGLMVPLIFYTRQIISNGLKNMFGSFEIF